MFWMMSANSKMYDHARSFSDYGYIDWRQKSKFQVNDIVFIYCTNPLKRVRYKCQVKKTDIPFSLIRDDEEYWSDKEEYQKSQKGKHFRLLLIEELDSDNLSLDQLKNNGLVAAPQGPIKIKQEVISYLEKIFRRSDIEFSPEVISENMDIYEGVRKTIQVNKYERSTVARTRCIEKHGVTCTICDFNFEKVYDYIGKGFIHVHHIVPIHTIGENYKINYETDLIPVCPNCHAMLHKKFGDNVVSISELKKLVRHNNTIRLST